MNFALCGFMGCGKTTIGRRVARAENLEFIDIDAEIVKEQGMKITEIFEKHGEEYFRALEHDMIKRAAKMDNVMISLGGGAVTNPENVQALRECAKIIYLQMSEENIKERLKNNTTRPLLLRPDRDIVLHELYVKRLPLYNAAASIVVDANAPYEQVVWTVRTMMQAYMTKLD